MNPIALDAGSIFILLLPSGMFVANSIFGCGSSSWKGMKQPS